LAELRKDFQLVIPDQRGTGASDEPDSPYLLADLAKDALAVLDAADLRIAQNEELLVTLSELGARDTPLHTLLRQNEAVQQFDS
jgi:hypothetical protein